MRLNWTYGGEGPPLLLLHGFTGIGADWGAVFGDAVIGFKCLMPDLPGHGLSPSLDSFTFEESARLIIADLEEMGYGSLPAMGMSGGAQVLLHIATRKPELVTRSVLISTAPYFPDVARQLMAQAGPEQQPKEAWDELRRKHPGGDDQVRRLFETAQGFHASYWDVNFTPAVLGLIQGPSLIVHGDQDPLYPISSAVELYSNIGEASLWILPDAGHCPIFGEQAEVFTQTALKFLKR
ncbi:pimeloyl-ACP methyl ester carboxylesterase [Yoonia maricola]|uniref:Pimeloyl-ACP methyl ester carboxylesterase n=1 Tax=Yoonia maricola TaxID=420999 RepID=A0A2M8WLW2_9RHOB|nr:alpha/beta hydrolase [Yoonia maricola]PJI91917.1 pimeloyl-ACP methyl ester carboxylesterase [Yoonia maricola]